MTTTTDVSTEKRLTIVKHLAGGKDLDTTAAMTRLDRRTVLDIASHHGYPSTELLTRAIGLLEKRIEREHEPIEHPDAARIEREQRATQIPPSVSSSTASRVGRAATTGNSEPLTKPDEIRVLINTSKTHPSKRVQAAGDRVLAAVGRLRDLIREDEEKHAEKRRREAERVAARAEVERLTKQLADAKAKLRGSKPAAAPQDGPSAAEIRAWAASAGVDCPATGRVPVVVRSAYDETHKAAV